MLDDEPELEQGWHPQFGDRLNKLVLIGIEMDKQAITAELDECLLTDEEMSLDWSQFTDTFPNPTQLA
ncbi:GTP-binding protein [Paenibacillus septentrionalis]|uniref:GTP-binding protein n=1 Tax=Paenibacillus septentrionalis TaxID=429342 RepID=A0ABW1UX39_9BACL